MSNVNYTFGVLCGGNTGIRYSNCLPTEEQAKLLDPLWSKIGKSDKSAEVLIRLLRCSEHWPKYCSTHDDTNTYHIDADLNEANVKFDALVDWADKCTHLSSEFPVYKTQTAVDRVTNRLFGVLTIK